MRTPPGQCKQRLSKILPPVDVVDRHYLHFGLLFYGNSYDKIRGRTAKTYSQMNQLQSPFLLPYYQGLLEKYCDLRQEKTFAILHRIADGYQQMYFDISPVLYHASPPQTRF